MKKVIIYILIAAGLHPLLYGQYISEVIEYKPAPGQMINSDPWGMPSSANSIIGGINGSLCLGGFGGYVIFKFENPVENHTDNPFGIDFTIFGNPLPDWSEPAVVYVMKDENANGLADDTWYELAGSDYYFSSTNHNYEITYSNPGGETATDVPWTDNSGSNGYIFANSQHTQSYYPSETNFPDISNNQYSLSGTRITGNIDKSNPTIIKSYIRAFGYVDNQFRGSEPYTKPDNPYTPEKENSGGDAFDISWAVNSEGNYVDLDEIHFIKVQNAINDNGGWLGEVSTEITGAVDVSPDASITGLKDIIVIKYLPLTINTETLQLEVFVFTEGRLQANKDYNWSIDLPGATIDDNDLLSLTQSGELTITATLTENSEVFAVASSSVDISSSALKNLSTNNILIYPNPTINHIQIKGISRADISITDITGKTILVRNNVFEEDRTDISHLKKGLYIITVKDENNNGTYKLFKD